MFKNLRRNIDIMKMKGRHHSPEIKLAISLIGFGISLYTTYKGTVEAVDIVDEYNAAMAKIEKSKELAQDPSTKVVYPVEKEKEDRKVVYVRTMIRMIKAYAKTAIIFTSSALLNISAFKELRALFIGTSALLTSVTQRFNRYRNKVKEELGEEKDMEFMYDTKEVAVTETVSDDGEVSVEKQVVQKLIDKNSISGSSYGRFFDADNRYYAKSNAYNRMTLRERQEVLYQKACRRSIIGVDGEVIELGWYTLNEFYECFGVPERLWSKAGTVVGKLIDPRKGSEQVDYGLYTVANDNFRSGNETVFYLDPVMDGVIIDKIHIAEI